MNFEWRQMLNRYRRLKLSKQWARIFLSLPLSKHPLENSSRWVKFLFSNIQRSFPINQSRHRWAFLMNHLALTHRRTFKTTQDFEVLGRRRTVSQYPGLWSEISKMLFRMLFRMIHDSYVPVKTHQTLRASWTCQSQFLDFGGALCRCRLVTATLYKPNKSHCSS